jgi:hypothetical protein
MKASTKRFLRFISLGKYQTTFYNDNDSPFMSSVIGGLVTLILVVGVGIFMSIALVTTFQKSNHNLDLRSKPIQAYLYDKNVVTLDPPLCTEKDCQVFKVKDFIKTLGADFTFRLFNVT